MKITRRQLRRIIKEAWDPGPDDETLEIHPADRAALDKAGYVVGSLVRAVDFVGDERGGDWKKVVGDETGSIIEIDDSEDGPIQYTVNWESGEVTMDDSPGLEIVKESTTRTTKRQLTQIIKEQLIRERMNTDVYKIVVQALDKQGPKTHQELLATILDDFPNTSDEELDGYIDNFEESGDIIFDSATQTYH